MTISPEIAAAIAAHREAIVNVYAPGSRRVVEEQTLATFAAQTAHMPMLEILGYLIDPCSRILYRSISTARVNETEADRLERIRRRKAKDALAAEEAAAKAGKARRA